MTPIQEFVRYLNRPTADNFTLEPGEVPCDLCNTDHHGNWMSTIGSPYCKKCKGVGKVTWIQNVFK